MYSNIMIPVSFDENRDAASAIKVAQCLAEPGARLTFVHILETIPAYVIDAIPPDTFRRRRDDTTANLLEITKSIENAHGIVLDGSPGRTICDWAKENTVDCIVIASHQPGLADIFLGSTAAFVVRHARCAVHVLR